MTKYMVYFEPMEIDADNLNWARIKCDDMRKQQYGSEIWPKILKVIPTEFVFDCEPKKEKIV